MKFSLIIPCYNTSRYIERCLNSVINQTYEDWEMIAVDDGSMDDTLKILMSYSEKDSRIKVINQENKGVSAARNIAVESAQGDYLIFIDSDDWYKDEYGLEQIVEVLNGNDIVVFRYQLISEKSCKDALLYFEKMKECSYSGEEYLYTVLSRSELYLWGPWIYAFRKEFWTKNNFKFDEELWIGEDADIIYKVLLNAQRIKVLYQPIYQYYIRQESASNSISLKLMQASLSVFIKNINTVKEMNINEDLKRLFYNNFAATYFNILSMANYLNKDDRRVIFNILYKNRYLMKYAITKKKKVIKMLAQIIGIRATSRILFIRLKYIKRVC